MTLNILRHCQMAQRELCQKVDIEEASPNEALKVSHLCAVSVGLLLV